MVIKCVYLSIDVGDCLPWGGYNVSERNGGWLLGEINKLNNRLILTV